jgi:DNA polymerase-1
MNNAEILNNSPEISKETVYLIDGSGYIFRAYYAVAPLTTKDGFPTNALYGFTRMLGKLLSIPESSHMAMVFDSGKLTFRNELYSEYKANRSECPADLVPQMPLFRDISVALGLPVFEAVGYEADDIIGTLTKKLKALGHDVVIVSGDKDLCQLVESGVKIWDTMKDKKFGIEGVQEKFGVAPEFVVDVLALMGDSSDNIPGLSGVGPKTATQLVQQYGSVEKIIESVAEIKLDKSIRGREKLAATIETEKEILLLSKKLAQILIDAPFNLNVFNPPLAISDASDEQLMQACKRQAAEMTSLSSLFERLGFSSLLKELPLATIPRQELAVKVNYITIDKSKYAEFLSELQTKKEFAFDLETTSLDPIEAKIVGASFCWTDSIAYYLPIAHTSEDSKSINQVDINILLNDLNQIFSNENVTIVGQNIKYDISVLASCSEIKIKARLWDTMVAGYLLSPDSQSFNMTSLANTYLRRGVIEYESLKGVEEGFNNVSIKDATEYSAEDAHVTWCLKNVLHPLLESNSLLKIFSELEMPLINVLSTMELTGVKLDTKFLSEMSQAFDKELEIIKTLLINMAGEDFNLNSPKQLAEIMFERLNISTRGVKKTKTGFSTDSSVLEMLGETHEFPRQVLRYRSLFKLKSTYIDALPAQINQKTGRLHSKFNQTVTSTGRLSSSEPNLQNIPIQSEEGRKIRNSFIAEDNHCLISADYSQIELRILAQLSEDKNLISSFIEESDIHSKTAREIFNIPPILKVTSEQRRVGKTMNFGIIYGMSGFRLSKELGISVKEADSYIQQYFAQYPNVKKYFSTLEMMAVNQGYVETAFGRKRFIKAAAENSERDKGFINRIAINAPIQGTAADIVKIAMINIHNRIINEKLPLKLILQVHDELVFECPKDKAEAFAALIKSEMENAVTGWAVPLKVEVGTGLNWGHAH